MNNELTKTFQMLEAMNTHLDKILIPHSSFQQEYQRIYDIQELDKNSDNLIYLLQNTTNLNFNSATDQLCYLHINLNSYAADIDNLREFIENFIDSYQTAEKKICLNK